MKNLLKFSLLILSFTVYINCELLIVNLHRVNVKLMRKKMAVRMNFRRKEFHRPYKLFMGKSKVKKLHSILQTDMNDFKIIKRAKKTVYRFKENYSTAKIYLMNYADIQYWGNLALGEKKDKFNVLFDTGSSWTWLPSKKCNSCKQVGIKNLFSCQNSATCYKDPMEVEIEYGKGAIEGTIAHDDVTFDGKVMKDQPFLMVEKVSDDMPNLMFDGLVGLAPATHMMKYNSFLSNMKEKNIINKKSFSIFLNKQTQSKKSKPVVIFGGYKESYTSEKMHFCEKQKDNYWSVKLHATKLNSPNGQSVTLPITSKTALLDTGTSIITLPEQDFNSFLAEIQKYDRSCYFSNDDFEIVCPKLTHLNSLPSLAFNLCGKDFEMTQKDYGHVEDNGRGPIAMLKIGFVNLGNSAMILGDPFLQTFYTYYDSDDSVVGIAKAIELE